MMNNTLNNKLLRMKLAFITCNILLFYVVKLFIEHHGGYLGWGRIIVSPGIALMMFVNNDCNFGFRAVYWLFWGVITWIIFAAMDSGWILNW